MAAVHLLLIEDNPDDLIGLRRMLLKGSARQYRFTEAQTGAAGIEACRNAVDPPDCVLLDFYLPDMDGLEVLAALRQGHKLTPCPIVVLTGGSLGDGQSVIRAGAQDYIGKSWSTPQSLARAIDNAWERFAMAEEGLRYESALRASEAHISSILGSITDGLTVLDQDWQFAYLSEPASRILGIDPNDLHGRSIWDFLPASQHAMFHQKCRLAIETGQPSHFEAFFPEPVRRWLECHCYPFEQGLSVYFQNITERKLAQLALADSEKKLRAIFDGVDGFVSLLAVDGTVIEANHASLAFDHSQREDVVGRPFWETLWFRVTQGAPAKVRAEIERAAKGDFVQYQSKVVMPPGEELTFEISLKPVCGENGQIFLIVAEARDITSVKQAEGVLQVAARRKDDFLAMLAHELKNPLGAIRWAVHVSLASRDDSVDWRSDMKVIDRQTSQLSRLVDDLLDVARIDHGRIELRVEEVDLTDVLKGSIAAVQPHVNQKGHSLTIDVNAENMLVRGDAARLEQVFGNILNNAAKYTPGGGSIHLEARRENGEASISVTDNGVGIPEDLLPYIFDRFRQGKTSLNRAEGGLGIGLSLVKALVDMHAGKVDVATGESGKGTKFTVRLPIISSVGASS